MNAFPKLVSGEAGVDAGAAANDAVARIESDRRLAETLMRLGKLNEEALGRILLLQQQTNAPFARAASKLGLVSRDDVETAIGVQHGFIRDGDGEGKLPTGLVIVRRPRSKESEQFRAMRTRLLTGRDADKLKLFAIASNRSHIAADHVCLNLAASFAQLKKRVLIVDADLRSTRLQSVFGLDHGAGFRETLSGDCDIRRAIRPTIIANLSVLTSGMLQTSGHELLSSASLNLIFEYLRAAFDIVIVMTAPHGPIVDAQFVWAAAGAAFVVVRRHEDRLPELKDLNTALRQVDAAMIGAALTG
jgi:capsular exopolysaccharide synthesis family protein